jgi:predicted DNA-binding protein (MmcQ/YjbR family)
MKFDVILANPPFQDRDARGKTPHKLWIDFTFLSLKTLLKPKGWLIQVSPASFASPSSKVLKLFKEYNVKLINFDVSHFFPGVGSSFAYYSVENAPARGKSALTSMSKKFNVKLDESIIYLPNDICAESMSIHNKVMFLTKEKLDVKYDYVNCHNILLKTSDTLSKTPTDNHVYPVFHTNKQIWYSSIQQPHLKKKKVLWTRSGYTKPFYDSGKLGTTDMGYYVEVKNSTEGKFLAANLSSELFSYIFKTAKWSGFGNEIVFSLLPKLPNKALSDIEIYKYFNITEAEIDYIRRNLGTDKK